MSDELLKKIRIWLDKEGYPTEFRTASTFRSKGFVVRQGSHVREGEQSAPREIDVLASMNARVDGGPLLRIYHVVECKLSKDKPWIVFTDSSGRISTTACIAQTMGSTAGSCLLWIEAGRETMHELDLFRVPSRPGFGGRQVFASSPDNFYGAMSSVTQLSVSLMKWYDDRRPHGELPNVAAIAFPVVVVDAPLFQAYYCAQANDIVVEPAKWIRCHWKGSSAWQFHATVDIVSFSHLDEFAEARAQCVRSLIEQLRPTLAQLVECFRVGRLEGLQISPGSRGVVGLHPLLQELTRRFRLGGEARDVKKTE